MPGDGQGRGAAAPLVPDGVLVIDKPEGPTSHDVVARVRRALRLRQVGHTGTLDPMATGVLALVIGRATRLAQFLSGRDKVYRARVRLGITTDTWDRTGTPLHRADAGIWPDTAVIRTALATFVGEHLQAPPPFSAKKIGGVRAHELARKGHAVNARPVLVTLHSAEIVAVEPPCVDLDVHCSAGFYVRALAHELGQHLGCGACLESLRRTASGDFTIAEALPLERVEQSPAEAVERSVPMEQALPALPRVVLSEAAVIRALHGNEIGPDDWTPDPNSDWNPASAGPEPTVVRLAAPDGRLLAIARTTTRPGVLHPYVVLK